MYGCPGFELHDPILMPFQLHLSSPFTVGWPSFASSSASLRLHPSTAKIVDEIRSMIEAVLLLPADPTPDQLVHVTSIASWVHGEVESLPENVPLYYTQQSRVSPGETTSDTSSPPNAGEVVDKETTPPAQAAAQGKTTPRGNGSGGAASKSVSSARSSPPREVEDPVYRMVRLTASVYCRAVMHRVPTSKVLTKDEFFQIWSSAWRCPMAARSSILGIFLWAMLLLAPSCHELAQARFVKTMVVNGFLTAAVDNWHVAIGAAEAALRFQRWLKGESSKKGFIVGGEKAVDKYGFAVKEALQNIANVHKGNDDSDDEIDELMDV